MMAKTTTSRAEKGIKTLELFWHFSMLSVFHISRRENCVHQSGEDLKTEVRTFGFDDDMKDEIYIHHALVGRRCIDRLMT